MATIENRVQEIKQKAFGLEREVGGGGWGGRERELLF